MGLFSSRSRSTTTSTSQNQGFSEIGGSVTALNVSGSGNAITLSDYGAIAAAQSIAESGFKQVATFSGLIGAALSDSLSAASRQTAQAIQSVSESRRTETENLGLNAIKWGALAFGAYALARIFWKRS